MPNLNAKRGQPLTAAQQQAVIDAHLAYLKELETKGIEPKANYSEISRRLGHHRDTIGPIIRNYQRGISPIASLIPAPVVENPAPNPEEEWMRSLQDWAVQNNQPIPERVRNLLGFPMPQGDSTHGSGIGPTILAPKNYRKVVFLSDIHIPYHDKVATHIAVSFLNDYKPDLVILGGDIFDAYDISDHAKDPDRQKTLQDEFDEGRDFLTAVDRIGADVIYLEGNHEERLKRLISQNRGLFKLRSLDFPVAAGLPARWKFYPDQTHYRLGKLLVLHGNLKGRGGSVKHAAANMLGKLRTSALFGHWHRFGAYYETDYEGTTRAGFANGHLCDVKEARYIRCPDWQSGFSVIELAADYSHFAVHQHLIINGKLLACGKEYSL